MDDLVICTGMSVLDIPVRGMEPLDQGKESNVADRIGMNLGGDAVNEAVVLTKLGKNVKLYTAFSDNTAAKVIQMLLDEQGVDYFLSETRPGAMTHICIPIVLEDAERVFLSARKENFVLDFAPDPAKIAGAKIVTLASLYSYPYSKQENAVAVAKQAKENGALVMADLTYQKNKGDIEDFADVWPYVDYLFPNDGEAAMLTGETDPAKMAEKLLEVGVKHAVIKIGKRGCYFRSADEEFIVEPHLVEAVDTTGAGDNFCAGFICGLLEDKDHRECCRYANAAASICIRYDGASTGIQSREQLQEVLDNY